MCLFFRQNGENGLHQAEDNLIPQWFNIRLWINRKNLWPGPEGRGITPYKFVTEQNAFVLVQWLRRLLEGHDLTVACPNLRFCDQFCKENPKFVILSLKRISTISTNWGIQMNYKSWNGWHVICCCNNRLSQWLRSLSNISGFMLRMTKLIYSSKRWRRSWYHVERPQFDGDAGRVKTPLGNRS